MRVFFIIKCIGDVTLYFVSTQILCRGDNKQKQRWWEWWAWLAIKALLYYEKQFCKKRLRFFRNIITQQRKRYENNGGGRERRDLQKQKCGFPSWKTRVYLILAVWQTRICRNINTQQSVINCGGGDRRGLDDNGMKK